MGTPDFAVASLRRLVEDGHEVVGVFTQPDKPKNRGMKLTFSPVKEYALTQDLPVYQPLKMRDGEALGILRELAPELIVVAAYGKILPQEILDLPQYGCINVHSSLLPKYRGAAPINWAILNGERITGVSIMYMVAALDAGDVIRTVSTEIGEREDAAALTVKRGSRTIELSAEPEKDEDGECAAASPPFSARSGRNSSMVSRLCPPMAVMTSPSLSPQSFAGLSPSEKPTTSTPSEKSLTPTVCPTGISSLTVRSAACADGIAIAAAAKNPSRIAAARFFVRCVPSILSPL